jgi:hypothetical protein
MWNQMFEPIYFLPPLSSEQSPLASANHTQLEENITPFTKTQYKDAL